MEEIPYNTKDDLLAYVRSRNLETTGQFSETVQHEFSGDSDHSTDIDGELTETASTISGRDGSIESGQGSRSRPFNTSGQYDSETGRNDSRTNQHSGRVSENQSNRVTRETIITGIKSRVAPVLKMGKTLQKSLSEPGGKTKKKPEKLLTDAEIAKLKPKLINAIIWQTDHMDSFIQATTKKHLSVFIWSTMDENEAELLAKFLLARGKRDATTATLVRQMADLMEKIELGLILLPRAYATMRTYFERGFSIF